MITQIINIDYTAPLSKLVVTASFPKSFIGNPDTKRAWIPAFAGMTGFVMSEWFCRRQKPDTLDISDYTDKRGVRNAFKT